jgi:hypothetical protein
MDKPANHHADISPPRSSQLSDLLERDRAISQPKRFAPLRRSSQGSYRPKGSRASEGSVGSEATTATFGGMESDDFFSQMRAAEEESDNSDGDEQSEEAEEEAPVRQKLRFVSLPHYRSPFATSLTSA